MAANSVVANAPNLGEVMFGSQYNVKDTTFQTEAAMRNTEFSSAAKVTEDLLHPIECDGRVLPIAEMYTNRHGAPNTLDEFSIWCLTTFACTGVPAAGTTGKFGVIYDIEFFNNVTDVPTAQNNHLINTVGVSAAAPLGTVPSPFVNPYKFNEVTITGVANNVINFNNAIVGKVKVDITWKGANAACAYPSLTPDGTFCTVYNDFESAGTNIVGTTPNANTSTLSMSGTFILTGGGAQTLTVATNGTLPASITSVDLFITFLDINL